MKYIDAEKIRSEVERIKEAGCASPISVCNDILSFIDFLQQEQPEVDLEKELQLFLCNYDYEFDDDAPAYDIAKHFYELGLKARKEE